MLMSPHHLQQQDLYHEHLLFARTEAQSPYGFGAVSLELDPGRAGPGGGAPHIIYRRAA
jgi:predicted component of type VI protein secretion system